MERDLQLRQDGGRDETVSISAQHQTRSGQPGVSGGGVGPASGVSASALSATTALPSFGAVQRPGLLARRLPASVSVETFLYLIILIAAVLSRFWDLGSKTLHHDESLHTYYSWELATGRGYVHDPLMHGPFLFHANALIYWLFGATDATSRYMPALFGVIVVALPWLLRGRQFLGRWGALAASFFFLISPSILYQSRYIRHDIYTIAGTLLLFICVVRFVDERRRAWLVTGAATIAFLLTNHEIVFAILAVFGGYLYGATFVEHFRAWRTRAPRLAWSLVGIHVVTGIVGLALFKLVSASTKAELLAIPWQNPTPDQQREYYKTVFTNPMILGYIVLFALFCAALVLLTMEARKLTWPADCSDDCQPERRDGSVSRAIRSAAQDGHGLLMALVAGLAIFVPLYTTLFQNMRGLQTSTVATDGTLLYWLGQHDVRRGEQPWFYFLLILPQYEFLAVILGAFMLAVVAWQVLMALAGRDHGRQLFFRLFVVVWFLAIFAGLSYAGEKMPWLIVHIALPGILLASIFMQMAIERGARLKEKALVPPFVPAILRADWILTELILVAGGAWIWIAARLTYGDFRPEATGNRGGLRRFATDVDIDHWWWLAVPWLVVIGLLFVWTLLRGPLRTSLATLAALVIGLSLLQVHAGWRLSYLEADVPRDMLVYTQTSPDVQRVMNEIDELSALTTGGKHLVVVYDSHVSWPYQWYLRDYDNKQFVGDVSSGVNQDAAVILARSGIGAETLPGYTATEYVLRWWFPEETYRDFALAPEIPPGRSAWKRTDQPHGPLDIVRSILDTISNQQQIDYQLRLYRLLMYRDLDSNIGQTNFTVYIRNDLLPLYNSIRYGS